METLIPVLVWPAAAIIIGFGALLILRAPLVRLIDRSNKLAVPGVGTLDAEPQKQIDAQTDRAPSSTLPAPQQAVGAPAKPPFAPLIAPMEAEIKRSVEEVAPGDLENQLAWAIRTAALAQTERNYEITYRIIFGSQIATLKEMNVRNGLSVRDGQVFYEKAAAAHPEVYANFTFEQWSQFLHAYGLAHFPERTGAPEDKAYITPTGKDFLVFLVTRGLLENKAF